MFNQIPRKSYQFLFLVLALAMMILPFGVAMPFADGPDSTVVTVFPYFDLTPWGYGNWFPLLAGAVTLAALVLLFLQDRKVKGKLPMAVCLGLAMVCSVLSWLVFSSYTGGSLVIVVFQGLCLLFQLLPKLGNW